MGWESIVIQTVRGLDCGLDQADRKIMDPVSRQNLLK